ncbi:uncharacterized protein ARMOST_20883 [Armillaria ostoyae]|uniref:F-box domain-containing protein n=1 Tax=Armillaria ostoyae TaxID=47428 RepID=A0A284S8K5_ARMOS|nr:uncharacterized protein ARMOST_20883 [Armillaria ostoyae]
MSMHSTLYDLLDNVLIYTIAFLSVPDILFLRQTCKRFNALTRLCIVWRNVFKVDIVLNNYPFSLNDANIEHRTRQAYRLASRWLADSCLNPKSETTLIGSPVSEIIFVPGRQHKWVLTIWDVAGGRKCSEWSQKGAIFTGVKLNADPRIALLHLDDNGTLDEIHSIDSNLCPVNITGDVISLSDDVSKMLINNWKTKEQAHLDDVGDNQHDHCNQVVFTLATILVVCTHSIALYTSPPHPTSISTHSFSWVHGASVTLTSILVRSQSDNPWASELNSLELYSFSSFPPTLSSKVSSHHGALRCTDVILGKRDTAVRIHPHDRTMVSHLEEHNSYETLIAAVFPGPLNPPD